MHSLLLCGYLVSNCSRTRFVFHMTHNDRTSRLSILCTVIRITTTPRMRRFLHICVYLFIISWIVLFAQVFWICIPEQSWKSQPTPQCFLGDDAAVAQSISTCKQSERPVYPHLIVLDSFHRNRRNFGVCTGPADLECEAPTWRKASSHYYLCGDIAHHRRKPVLYLCYATHQWHYGGVCCDSPCV